MRKGKKTRTEEEFGSDETTPEPSGGEEIGHDDDDDDSSSSEGDGNDGSEGDGNDGNDSGVSDGDEGGGADTSSYYIGPTIMFTGEEDFTHATQDTDHGAPTSQRQTTSTHRHGRQAHLHMMKIAPTLPPVVSTTTRTVLLPLKGAFCGHHQGW